MVNKSTKEGEKNIAAEDVVPSSDSKVVNVNNASEEALAASQPQVQPDEKSHGDAEEAGQGTTDAKTVSEEPAKKSRGRPKKSDGSEPPVKKAKKEKEKERQSPARASARVKNQMAGVKLDNAEELPERKRSPTKKVAKNGVEQNGAAVKA